MGSSNRVSSNEGRIIFHSNYDKTPINSEASSRINLKETTNLCRADDGYLTACSGWENLIKVRKIVPYTFCIPQHLWDHIKNRQPFEYDMALRFGLEFDLKEIEKSNPGLIYTEYFHTLMYLRFSTYLYKISRDKALIAATELLKDSFDIRVTAHYKNLEDIIKLTPAGYGIFDKARYIALATNNRSNRGALMIGHRLYQMIFNKKWNRQAYELCRTEYGYQVPISEENESIDTKNW
ncbi:hypothetical protein MMP74_17360 [Acinetobacter sp. NIPH 1869]|uniref:hypothetical protein n=1 Tax=Acinetobacter higginsii TaxID=70347 RepID=UPI001F4A695C|nr:hypothetical protein [Acinetobacter higginsii]MCH7306121.1 hypothetical protein [Acinetobacter higginsii]